MDTRQLKDEDILRQSIATPSVFAELVNRYQGPLTRVAYNVLRSHEEAQDVVQEAFTKIYLSAHKFEVQEGASFESWAYRITFNAAISQYRKLKRKYAGETTLELEHYENLGYESRVDSKVEAAELAEQLLLELPADLQHVVREYYYADKSYQTIAEESGLSLPTIKMRLYRAKQALKQRYDIHTS